MPGELICWWYLRGACVLTLVSLKTVGIAGGYIAGGGHSMMSSLVGMAADQMSSSAKLVTRTSSFSSMHANIDAGPLSGCCPAERQGRGRRRGAGPGPLRG